MPQPKQAKNTSQKEAAEPTWLWAILILSLFTLALQFLPAQVLALLDPRQMTWRSVAVIWVVAIVALVAIRSKLLAND